jgi:hypothetical protein
LYQQCNLVSGINMDDGRPKLTAEQKAVLAERMRILKMNSRMGLPWHVRFPFATSIAFTVGMLLGTSHGSQAAGLRFRAENAHRLPTTPTGWYLYHKSKNYQRAYGGVMEGIKMGARVSIWTAGFFAIEEMYDRYRGTKDFVNTVFASLSVAGVFSIWSKSKIRLGLHSVGHHLT